MVAWTSVLHLAFIVGVASADPRQDGENCTDTKSIGRESDRPVVRIKDQGLIRGRTSQNGSYYEFLGIPYAKASNGSRFKIPLPVPTWKGVREATTGDIVCLQRDSERVIGTEDCLVLNVYTPKRKKHHGPLPVMVFVHGGDFNYGSGSKDLYGPDRFMQENVILITVNYRLSILGFLCIGDTANVGIKDVIASLKWVQANIESFGGDRGKVTLFGESTGAAVVELLMLSKTTQGLIHKVITQSGSALSPWAFGSDPKEKAFTVGKLLGYEGQDSAQLLEVLKNANATDLINATETLTNASEFEFLPIGPCIEPASNFDAVVTSDPWATVKSGDFMDIPHILGINKDEGMLIYATLQILPDFLEILRKDFYRSLPEDLQSESLPRERIVESVKRFYFNGDNITQENIVKVVEYFTDVMYTLPAVKAARGYAGSRRRHAPVYMYEFAYDGGLPLYKTLLNLTSVPGVCHADELGYLFTQSFMTSDRQDDQLTARRIVRLWTDLAKFSNPTPKTSKLIPVRWEPVDGKDVKYLLINSTLVASQEIFKNRIDFWDNIYKQFYN